MRVSHRPLGEGEIIRADDEYYDDVRGWVHPRCVGEPAPNPNFTSHRQYRRAVHEADANATHLELVARVELLRAALRGIQEKQGGECRTVWASYPRGYSCLDVERDARSENPSRYAAHYREELLSGEARCVYCRCVAALAAATPEGTNHGQG